MKNMAKFGILAVFMMLLANFALAAVDYTATLTQPAASGNIAGATQQLNTTITNTTAVGLTTITNVTWFYTAAGGSITYWAKNSTGKDGVEANETMQVLVAADTKILYDSVVYTITTCAWNFTASQAQLEAGTATDANGNVTCDTSTSVTVDNTNPVCSITLPVTNTKYKPSVTPAITVSNASSCILNLNNKAYTGTVSGSAGSETCAIAKIEVPKDVSEGTYTFSATSTDSSGTADSTTCTVSSVMLAAETSAVRSAAVASDYEASVAQAEGGLSPGAKQALAIFGIVGLGYYLVAIKKVKLAKVFLGK